MRWRCGHVALLPYTARTLCVIWIWFLAKLANVGYHLFLIEERSMTTQVNMLEAKSQLSKLVKAAVAGEDVVIASNGVPVVRLVPVRARSKPRKPGAWSKLPAPAPDWDSPEFNRSIADALAGTQTK